MGNLLRADKKLTVVYFQPLLKAGKNYRNESGHEQVWCPWWALLLQQYAAPYVEAAQLIDARCDAQWLENLAATLSSDSVLAVSVMTGHAIHDAIAASQIAKEKGAQVFWGGPHATLFPTEVAKEPFVDHVIRGFGAQAFGQAMACLAAGGDLPDIVDSRGSLGMTPVTVLRGPTMAAAFAPALELVREWENYVNSDHAIGARSVNLITSEGCLRHCTYCSEPTTSRHSWLTYVVEESASVAYKLVKLTGADGIKLHDPNFFHDSERGMRFAQLLSSAVNMPWAATAHPADLSAMEEKNLAALAGFGLRRLLIGLESPVQAIVNLAGKNYDVSIIPHLAEKLARHNIAGMFTFIVGWPNADVSHYHTTINTAYAVRAISSLHQAKIHFLEPWPGTPLYKLLSRRGLMPQRKLSEWADIDYYFAHLPELHASEWEIAVRRANQELSPYVEA